MIPSSDRPARRRPRQPADAAFDAELAHLPPAARWREWMGRVEAVIFAADAPVPREQLARLVGRDCNLDLLIDDIGAELRGRPYELVAVAGGFQHRTRPAFAGVIAAALGTTGRGAELSPGEALVLMGIAYFQPVTRAELSALVGREVSRDTIAGLRAAGFIVSGPRSPRPGAPYTYVTTRAFLSHFGLDTLHDLPDREALEDAGLLSRAGLEGEGEGEGGGGEGGI